MVNGKKKGKNGELEVVRLCRAQGYEARRSAQSGGTSEPRRCPGPGFKRCEKDYRKHSDRVPPEKRDRLEGDHGSR